MDPRFQNTQSKSRVQQPAYFLSMNCLLCSRVDTGRSGKDYYEDDVNAYMKHLLTCLEKPTSITRSRRYISKYDAEVIRRLHRSREARLRYTIYRTDSDFLLLSVGTFATPPIRRGRGRQEPLEEGYVGRGKTYYHFAYAYSQRMHLHNTATAEVLEKLVLGFERYTTILARMRGEEGNPLEGLRLGERFILERSVGLATDEEAVRAKQEDLLEAISLHHAAPSTDTRRRVAVLVEELSQIKPDFRYDLDRLAAPAGDTQIIESAPPDPPATREPAGPPVVDVEESLPEETSTRREETASEILDESDGDSFGLEPLDTDTA